MLRTTAHRGAQGGPGLMERDRKGCVPVTGSQSRGLSHAQQQDRDTQGPHGYEVRVAAPWAAAPPWMEPGGAGPPKPEDQVNSEDPATCIPVGHVQTEAFDPSLD